MAVLRPPRYVTQRMRRAAHGTARVPQQHWANNSETGGRIITKRVGGFTEIHKVTKVLYLPTYSPELNPDEMVNQDVKANAFRNAHSRNQPEGTSKNKF